MNRASRVLAIVCTMAVLLAAGTWAWQRYRVRPVSIGSDIAVDSNVEPSTTPVILAAGDIATCGIKGSADTAAILGSTDGTILALGDEAYPAGSPQQFHDCYGPTWGKYLARTRPVPGNHEYVTANAAGYFEYFGASAGDPVKGYYSYNLGTWHVVALNSECSAIGGCGADSPEVQWLKEDLAAHPATCTLAYWHIPRFSSGLHGSNEAMQTLWQTAVDGGVDVVLNGHDHLYERFAPMDTNGVRNDATGTREFVVGTGGTSHYNFLHVLASSEARDNTSFGVLKLTLRPTEYDWSFLPVDGASFRDAGSGACH